MVIDINLKTIHSCKFQNFIRFWQLCCAYKGSINQNTETMEFDALKNSLMIYLDKQQVDNKATCTLNVSIFPPLKDA